VKMQGDVWVIGDVDAPPPPPKGRPARQVPIAAPRSPRSRPATAIADPLLRDKRLRAQPVAFTARRPAPSVPVILENMLVPAHEADAVAASLSLLIPGAGQALRSDKTAALFYISGTGLAAATAWAILATFSSLTHTLVLLGAPRPASYAILAAVLASGAAIHIAGVLHALRQDALSPRRDPHPSLAAAASAVVPGWGQILNGCPVRAGIFLGMVWLTAFGAAALSPAGLRILAHAGCDLPAWVNHPWGGVILLALPLLVWMLAVYDAAATALANRRG